MLISCGLSLPLDLPSNGRPHWFPFWLLSFASNSKIDKIVLRQTPLHGSALFKDLFEFSNQARINFKEPGNVFFQRFARQWVDVEPSFLGICQEFGISHGVHEGLAQHQNPLPRHPWG